MHVTIWHVDEREDDGIDEAEGVLLGANYTRNKTWMVFGRLGWSDADDVNDPRIYERSATPPRGSIRGPRLNCFTASSLGRTSP